MAFDQRASAKPPGRSRWNANQQQLQTLESIFEQGNGNTPNKARIKDIAVELSQYGQISETNVYNWFQNRKARAKRKLQHQVGRRRRLTRTTTANAPKLNRKGIDEVKNGDADTEVTSPRAKRLKTEGGQLGHNDHSLGLTPNPDFGAGSSGVEDIEGVLEEDLRSHVDFATLATDSQLPSVEHITHDMLFNEDHFHEQGADDSPNGQLQEISEEVKAWEDVRNSFGESSQIVDSQAPIHTSPVDNLDTFRSGLAGDKLISLAGGPVPSMDESRKCAPETGDLQIHEEAIPAAAPETCVS
ncbi:hypothetical protein KC19_1G087000 [Ceratodon purpureus]|uniref:Homeobox domain-containing protein n=1 Tax=Ceratodon purpureus TaxID=3225 RepID=A0A8T0J5H4_CERPU|nr:hypothetical protein KC19_1G087000 [Ceratodon purpureus]